MVFLNKKLKTVQSLNKFGLKTNFNLNNLNELSFKRLIYYLNNNYNLDNYLNNKSKANIKFKINLGTYEGNRHRLGYPVRGQRSLSNVKSQKRLHKFRLYFKVNKFGFRKNIPKIKKKMYPNYLYWADVFFPSFIKNSIYKKYYFDPYFKFERIPENWLSVSYYLVFDITQHWLISNCDCNLEDFYFLFLKKL